jgi:glycosyltransferase involved in cell wall biosynthesis
MRRHVKPADASENSAFLWGHEPAWLPQVTVIVPAHNMELFVERALWSAVRQTYPRLEVLVIDDGSTDRTSEIVEKFARAHDNLRVVTTSNGGVAAARNLGLDFAQSPYVAFLDADDLWAPDKIERQVAALASHGHEGEWAACYTLYRLIDEADMVIDNGPSTDERGAFFDQHLEWNHVGNGSSLLVRRDAALAVGGFNPEYARNGVGGCEDLEFQLKLLRRFKMELVRRYEVGYRIHKAQMSADLYRMRRSRVAVMKNVAAALGIPEDKRKQVLAQSYLMLARSLIGLGKWKKAARWIVAAVRLCPSESAMRIRRRARRDFEGLWQRASRKSPASAARSFLSIDPAADLDTVAALSPQQFGPRLAAARARSKPPAARSDRVASQ